MNARKVSDKDSSMSGVLSQHKYLMYRNSAARHMQINTPSAMGFQSVNNTTVLMPDGERLSDPEFLRRHVIFDVDLAMLKQLEEA